MGKVIRFIRADTDVGGNGSQTSPWGSFEEAEAADWDILLVLPSEEILYGGLRLKDGQIIEGFERESALLGSLDDLKYNGDVIVGVGDNKIRNLTFVESYRSAINALDSRDLTVSDCVIMNINTAGQQFFADYTFGNPAMVLGQSFYWPAISFYGGDQAVNNQIMPMNTTTGKFICHRVEFIGGAHAILVGSGDSLTNGLVTEEYRRHYCISHCIFRNSATAFENAYVTIMPGGGGYIAGKIKNCTFNSLDKPAISFGAIQAGYPNSDRGNAAYGRNLVKGCTFTDGQTSALMIWTCANQRNPRAEIILKGNTFNVDQSDATIDYRNYWMTEGLSIKLTIKHNEFLGTGVSPILAALILSDVPTVIDFDSNRVRGCASLFEIANRVPAGPIFRPTATLLMNVRKNKLFDLGMLMYVASANAAGAKFKSIQFKYEQNCAQNIGATLGAAIVIGGVENSYLQGIGLAGSLGTTGIVFDFGGGMLMSKGQNSFIDVDGDLVWIDLGYLITLHHAYFDNPTEVSDASIGGAVDVAHRLKHNPRRCETL